MNFFVSPGHWTRMIVDESWKFKLSLSIGLKLSCTIINFHQISITLNLLLSVFTIHCFVGFVTSGNKKVLNIFAFYYCTKYREFSAQDEVIDSGDDLQTWTALNSPQSYSSWHQQWSHKFFLDCSMTMKVKKAFLKLQYLCNAKSNYLAFTQHIRLK